MARGPGWTWLVLLALTAAAPARAQDYPSLFGTTETRSDNLAMFPKWTSMLARWERERPSLTTACEPTPTERCLLQSWRRFLDGLRGLDRMAQIREVNRRMNLAPYIEDRDNWGMQDYWETPGEFFTRSGDCEDYAIAKYLSLRLLGFSPAELRIAVVQDTNLNLTHSVLIVYQGGQALVLDNQIAEVVPAATIRHYQPFYTINEEHWWLHTPGGH